MREVRDRAARVRQGDLAGAVSDARTLATAVDDAARRVNQLRAALDAAGASRARALAGAGSVGVPVGGLAQLERYVRRIRHELDAARGGLARAEAKHLGQLAEVDAARLRLAHARAERELIERHFARWRAERQKLAERRED
jgi:hypothetical protein